MATKVDGKPLKVPLFPSEPTPHTAATDVVQPESNATRQLEKPRVRRKASADQAILQDKGPDALPVSDYPLKVGPVAANSLDRIEQTRARLRQKRGGKK